MGYTRTRATITVTWPEGDDLHGLEVVTRSLSLGTYLSLIGMGEVDRSGLKDMIAEFANSLVSWNLTDPDGEPVPATQAAALAEDHALMLAICSRWMDTLHGRDKEAGPLDQPSPGGEPSLEASIPMETVSPSPPS